jgi:hypothetical protein
MEELVATRYYSYDTVISASELVRQYMKKHKLILYGGQAIDYALRVFGDKLYEDYNIPDYDFYSPKNVSDAYAIFKLLIKAGYKDLSVLPGMHPTTMRVRVGLDFVADISYCTKRQFDFYKKTALIHDGCYIRHPYLQYADTHRAFAFPYENAPTETILARWGKDYERFCILYKYYPIKGQVCDDFFISMGYGDVIDSLVNLKLDTVPMEIDTSKIITGIAAFWVYYAAHNNIPLDQFFREDGDKLYCDCTNDAVPSYLVDSLSGGKVYRETIGRVVVSEDMELIHTNHAATCIQANILGHAVTIVSYNYLIIHYYTNMIRHYEITRAVKGVTHMSLYFQLLMMDYTKLKAGDMFAPSIITTGMEESIGIERYLEENRNDPKGLKPRAFYYQEHNVNAEQLEQLLSDIPTEFKYDKLFFM